MKNELLYLVWYTDAMAYSTSGIKRLEKHSVFDIYKADKETLLNMGFPEKQSERLSFKGLERAMQTLRFCEAKSCHVVPYYDIDYPEAFRRLPDAPTVIYVMGSPDILNSESCAALVGTRSSTYEGERLAERLANSLIDEGSVIVSGSADGIDSVGLITSLERKKPCISVLGCDIDKFSPQKSVRMLWEIVRCGGAVMSEYPPEAGAHWFATRNRLIAGLAGKVFVPEAPEKSGALITADYAFKYEIPVYAPNVQGDSFAGCRELVSRGALEISSDIRQSRKQTAKNKKEPVTQKGVETAECDYGSPVKNHVMKCILEGLDYPDKMANDEFKINKILIALTQLELSGKIEELPGNRYGKKR